MNPARALVMGLIHAYRWLVSPLQTLVLGVPVACRFQPSCSAYALEAVDRHGVVCGSALAAKRLCRCHPWGGSGWDPVPESSRATS
jgi:putative membrane protein insertion efficiency factor